MTFTDLKSGVTGRTGQSPVSVYHTKFIKNLSTGRLFHKLKFEANFRRSDSESQTVRERHGPVPGPLLEVTLDDLFV